MARGPHRARGAREAPGPAGATVWLTGLSGSGKSTIAVAAEQMLVRRGRLAYVLDGDNIRHGLNKNLGFSPEDRTENIRRIGEVAKLFSDAGVIVFSSFISPYRADRDAVRETMEEGDFIEATSMPPSRPASPRREGSLQEGPAGEIPEFTGISAPYEAAGGARTGARHEQSQRRGERGGSDPLPGGKGLPRGKVGARRRGLRSGRRATKKKAIRPPEGVRRNGARVTRSRGKSPAPPGGGLHGLCVVAGLCVASIPRCVGPRLPGPRS